MAVQFPTNLDDFTNPATSDTLDSPSHAGQHTDANDAIEALEAKVGKNGSTVTTSHDYKLANPNISLFNKLYAPEGFLLNGKIVPSVTSNNLTVAIKGLDGNNPSSTNPVYVRIGDAIRSITGALSVTKNAGTNWCNAGSSELATKEIDYFVYLGYNATDGVVIGFSRIPYATEYSQFSTTSTNEKYCAISTITNAAAGDDYVVIGRFAATLSAGAGYTWSVPTFDSKNLIQRPIFNTRTLSYTPTVSYAGGSTNPTSTTVSVSEYTINGSKFFVNNFYSVVKGAGDRTHWIFSIPMNKKNNFQAAAGHRTYSTMIGAVIDGTPRMYNYGTAISDDGEGSISAWADLA